MQRSAPSARARSSFSSLLDVTIARAPACLAKSSTKRLHAAADSRDQDGLSRGDGAARKDGAIRREPRERYRRGLLHREAGRLAIDVARRHRDVASERSVARHPEDRGRPRIPDALVVAPVQHRIDHDAFARADLARAVGAERHRQRDLRIEALGDEEVAPVERGGVQTDEHLVLAGARNRRAIDANAVRTRRLVEAGGLHLGGHSCKVMMNLTAAGST